MKRLPLYSLPCKIPNEDWVNAEVASAWVWKVLSLVELKSCKSTICQMPFNDVTTWFDSKTFVIMYINKFRAKCYILSVIHEYTFFVCTKFKTILFFFPRRNFLKIWNQLQSILLRPGQHVSGYSWSFTTFSFQIWLPFMHISQIQIFFNLLSREKKINLQLNLMT